jgi:hypothetical protein
LSVRTWIVADAAATKPGLEAIAATRSRNATDGLSK